MEQTLELRLPEGMPDIGRVIHTWGQAILRGKEWSNDGMTVSAGVKVWVLYAPESGEDIRSVEGWIPFSMKWDIPEETSDGKMLVSSLLQGVDARSISSRKLMVRATLGIMSEGWVDTEIEIPVPAELPEDVSLLKMKYPVILPKEAGEKSFLLEEHRSIPSTVSKIEKLLYYTLQPEIVEKKVMAGKIVFRGIGYLHVLYRGEDGRLCTWDCDVPFSQYADLQGSYDEDPVISIRPCVTSLDVSLDDNGEVTIKCGLVGQFLLCERVEVCTVEDAYSPYRCVKPNFEQLHMPAVLDQTESTIRCELSVQMDTQQIVDVSFYSEYVDSMPCAGGVSVPLTGSFQLLYYDMDGQLHQSMSRWDNGWKFNVSEDSETIISIQQSGKPQVMQGAGSVVLRGDVMVSAMTIAGQGTPVLFGMEMDDEKHMDLSRPNLIVCKKGENRLWDVAKKSGSTVEAILKANNLQEEPEANQVILIPVV